MTVQTVLAITASHLIVAVSAFGAGTAWLRSKAGECRDLIEQQAIYDEEARAFLAEHQRTYAREPQRLDRQAVMAVAANVAGVAWSWLCSAAAWCKHLAHNVFRAHTHVRSV